MAARYLCILRARSKARTTGIANRCKDGRPGPAQSANCVVRFGSEVERADDTAKTPNTDDEDSSTMNDFIKQDGKEREPPIDPPRYEKLAQKNPSPTNHLSITIGPPIIVLFGIVVPCIIYYVYYDTKHSHWADDCRSCTDRGAIRPLEKSELDEKINGYAVISFGFGELYILIARIYGLVSERDECAPLLSRSVWEDATSWVYGVSMICALIPFVIGSNKSIPKLCLYAPAFLMAFLGIIMFTTLIPVKIPVGINSHARGTRSRPFIYYAAEDFIAVDGLQDREFRVRYNARYDSSKTFRRMSLRLTLWWIFGVCVYIECLSAIIWTLEFHYAFGASLGLLFGYIMILALVSYYWVQIDMERQRKADEGMLTKC